MNFRQFAILFFGATAVYDTVKYFAVKVWPSDVGYLAGVVVGGLVVALAWAAESEKPQ